MMKFVFALVVLLHLCCGYTLNMTLNLEIKNRLDDLNSLYKLNNGSITLPDEMRMPMWYKNRNASSCVSVFVKELKQVLGNVTVHKASEHILQELEAGLLALDPKTEIDLKCKMTLRKDNKGQKPFQSYINFLTKLNNSRKR